MSASENSATEERRDETAPWKALHLLFHELSHWFPFFYIKLKGAVWSDENRGNHVLHWSELFSLKGCGHGKGSVAV